MNGFGNTGGFNFGGNTGGNTGGNFGFGANQPQQNTGFNFGGNTGGQNNTMGGGNTGFNFGGNTGQTNTMGGNSGFNMGGQNNTMGGGNTGFNFGGNTGQNNTMGGNTGFNFGGNTGQTNTMGGNTGFNMGGNNTMGQTGNTGFNFGGNTGQNNTGFNMGGNTNTMGGNTGFNFGGNTGQNNTGFNMGGNTNTMGGGNTGFNFGGTTGQTNTMGGNTGFNFGGNTGQTNTMGGNTGFNFGGNTGQTNTMGGNTGFNFGGNTGQTNTMGQTGNTGFNFGGSNTMGMGNNQGGGTVAANGCAQLPMDFKPSTDQMGSLTYTYHSISHLKPYQKYSFEEIRWMCYRNGKMGPYSNGRGLTAQDFSSGTVGTGAPTGTGNFGQAQNFGTNTNTGFNFGGTNQSTGFNQTGFNAGGTGQTGNTGFNFGGTTGQTGAANSSFNFGGTNTGQTNTMGGNTGFNFGGTTGQTNTMGQTGNTGFNFGGTTGATNTMGQTGNTGFNFGGNTGATNTMGQTGNTGFNFGGTTGTNTMGQTGNTGFNFGGTTGATNTGTTGGFNFGGTTGATNTGTTGGFNFGGTTGATNTGTTGGFNFGGTTGATNTGTTGGFNFGGTTNTGTTGGFNFGGTTGATNTGSTGGFNFGGTTGATTGTTGGFNFGGTTGATTGTTGGFNFGGTNTGGMNTGFNFGATGGVQQAPAIANPYANDASVFPAIFQQSSEEAAKIKDQPTAQRSALNIHKTPARIRPRGAITRETVTSDRLSLFENPAGADIQDNSFNEAGEIKSLVISEQNAHIPIPEEESVLLTPAKAPLEGAARRQEMEPLSRHQPVQKPTPIKKAGVFDPDPLHRKIENGTRVHSTYAEAFEANNLKALTPASDKYRKLPDFAPILTKKGYYTKPEFSELQQMSAPQLNALRDFEIGNSHGYIRWHGTTSICSVNFDDCVFINPKNVEVYPNPDNKPTEGKALNKPATITLFNVFPKHKDQAGKYLKKLKRACEKSDATFINYDDQTGEWVFSVKHFSKYGLDESDEDADEPEFKRPEPPSKKRRLVEKQIVTEEKPMTGERIPDLNSSDEEQIFLPLAHSLKLNPNKMHDMKNLFDEPVVQPKPKKRRIQEPPSSFEPAPGALSTVLQKSHEIKQTWRAKPLEWRTTIPKEVEPIPSSGFDSVPLPPNVPELPLNPRESVSYNQEVTTNEIIRMGRSFRVSFGPDGSLMIPSGTHVQQLLPESAPQHLSLEIQPIPTGHTPDVLLSVNLNYSVCVEDDDFVPLFKLNGDRLSNAAAQYQKNSPESIKSVFSLINVLWAHDRSWTGPIETRRIRLLTLWLQSVCQSISNPTNSPLREVFLLLTSFQLEAAIKKCIENQDFFLAMLISQCQNSETKADVRNQIANWKQENADQHIDEERMRIFKLISGDVKVPLREFEWKRCFALHLWYQENKTIDQVVASFCESFKNHACEYPYPPYIEEYMMNDDQSDSAIQEALSVQDPVDICFHLLQLYSDGTYPIHKIIQPFTVSTNLDYELIWHVYSFLMSQGYQPSQKLSETIHIDFAQQLEVGGYWQWAVFVLLHIQDHDNREAAVSACLNRNVHWDGRTDSMEVFLVEDLHIPQRYIMAAKAHRASLDRQHEIEFHCLLKSNQEALAKKVMLQHLAPNYVLTDQTDKLASICDQLEGTQFFQNYIEVIDFFKEQQFQPHILERANDKIQYLLAKIAKWKYQTTNIYDPEHVALSEISSTIVRYAGSLQTKLRDQQLVSLHSITNRQESVRQLVLNQYL